MEVEQNSIHHPDRTEVHMTSRSHPRIPSRAMLTGLILALVLGLSPALATGRVVPDPTVEQASERAQQRICNTRYPYAGCTWPQVKRLEFGSKTQISNHYVKFRWNQSRGRDHALNGIMKFPRANRHMRLMYNRAVHEHRERHGMTSLPYPTWQSFKHASGCSISPSSLAWCALGNWMGDEVTEPVVGWLTDISRTILVCGGKVLIGRWWDQHLDKTRIIVISAKSVVVRTGPGATLALAACVRDLYYDKLWTADWNPFK
jgi:hypothetical protein